MKLYEKLMLTHGFLFMTGMAYLMAWNNHLASFLHLGERHICDPLIFCWAVVLLYDAARRLPRRKPLAERVLEPSGAAENAAEQIRVSQGVRPVVTTVLRFLIFFAAIGAVGKRSLVGGIIVIVLFLTEIFLNRL